MIDKIKFLLTDLIMPDNYDKDLVAKELYRLIIKRDIDLLVNLPTWESEDYPVMYFKHYDKEGIQNLINKAKAELEIISE